MQIEIFATPGLGDATYLICSGVDAVLIDPQRDAWRFLAAADDRKVRVRAVLETHVHNDYISGAHEVRDATGAALVVPARGRYAFAHQAIDDGDEWSFGEVRLQAVATPGHTPEHLSYLAYQGDEVEPRALFSGGSLLVDSAGRTDLLGPDQTDALTRDQFTSLRRLAALPEGVELLPTHGAGSFCVATMPATKPTSSVGEQRRRNPLLLAPDLIAFAAEARTQLLAYPAYYAHMAGINRAGAAVLGALPQARQLAPSAVADLMARGAWVIDGRDRAAFARQHLPGSINIELNAGFASYVGWLLPFDAPLVLVLPESGVDGTLPDPIAEATTQLLRIGWSRVEGYLPGAVAQWRADGRSIVTYPNVDVTDLCDAQRRGEDPLVLDVRQELEWSWGTIPGSHLIFVGDLPARLASLPRDRPVWPICSNGHRAAIAASLLDRAGIVVKLVGSGGVGEWRGMSRQMKSES